MNSLSKLVFICSPYRAKTTEEKHRNVQYAKMLCIDAYQMGWIPIAPHLHYPQLFSRRGRSIPSDHTVIITSGLELLRRCDLMYVGNLYGISSGMKAAIDRAETHYCIRILYTDDISQAKSIE